MAAKSADSPDSKRIIFVHPDLGIGGAERLVVDAAVGLQNAGHQITVLTSYRDTNHCFDEARDGTLDVRVRGDALFPPSLGGRLSILFQVLRQVALVVSTSVVSSELKTLDPHIIIVDQLSACMPLFRLIYPKARILFYGHFPDRLLAKKGAGLTRYLKNAYRIPFDALEGWSTGCADNIVVNSKFTRSVFREAFPHMRKRDLKVIYPCVDTDQSKPQDDLPLFPGKKLLLSINRFEGKKNLALAVKAYAGLSAEERSRAKLVVAGGFDPRVHENNVTHRELQQLSDSLNMAHATFRSNDTLKTDMTTEDVDVLFLLSIPGVLKQRLLHQASLLVYTPENEHFGIVPLEAMLAGVPVLATNTGGPLETVYDGRTGWLRSPEKVAQWTEVMRKPLIPSSAATLQKMGQAGRDRVLAEFSQTKMIQCFDKEIQSMCQSTGPRPKITPDSVWAVLIVIIIAILAGGLVMGLTWWALSDPDAGGGVGRVLPTGHGSSAVAAVTSSVREEI